MQLTQGEKSRLILYKATKGNPQALILALDEIKRQATDALRATLQDAEPSVLRALQKKIDALFDRYSVEIRDQFERSSNEFIQRLDGLVTEKVSRIKPPKGDKGDRGDRPSTKELRDLILLLMPRVKDGRTPTRDDLSALMRPLISEAVANLTPSLQEKEEARKQLEDKVMGLVKKELGDQISQVKRFSGGGSGDRVEAGSGVTIETRPSGKKRISATGSFSVLETTGDVDDSNTDFTFTSKPTLLVVNGQNLREDHGWTWEAGTLTATLESAVGDDGDIYGIA